MKPSLVRCKCRKSHGPPLSIVPSKVVESEDDITANKSDGLLEDSENWLSL